MPSLIAPKSASSHPPAPEGSHVARCVSMIDLGSHESTGQYGTKRQRKLRLSFELPNELYVFSEEKGEQPFMVHQDFTFSMHEKAKLRAFLEVWRGRKFTEDEAGDFDVSKLVGVPSMLSIMHNQSQGRTYANIGAATKLPKGMECPPQINATVVFSLSEFEQKTFDALPDWLKEKIASSDEYAAMAEQESRKGGTQATEDDDDTPF